MAVADSEATSSTSLSRDVNLVATLCHNFRQAHSPCLGPREYSSRAAAARWPPAPFTLLRGGWPTLHRYPRGDRWELSGEGECRDPTVADWSMHLVLELLTASVLSRLFGFLFGCVLSGGAVYSYVLGEYKTSNDLLTEDIYVRLPELCGAYFNALCASQASFCCLRKLDSSKDSIPHGTCADQYLRLSKPLLPA